MTGKGHYIVATLLQSLSWIWAKPSTPFPMTSSCLSSRSLCSCFIGQRGQVTLEYLYWGHTSRSMQLSSSRLSQYQWLASASSSLLENRLPQLTFHLLVPNMVLGQNTWMHGSTCAECDEDDMDKMTISRHKKQERRRRGRTCEIYFQKQHVLPTLTQ